MFSRFFSHVLAERRSRESISASDLSLKEANRFRSKRHRAWLQTEPAAMRDKSVDYHVRMNSVVLPPSRPPLRISKSSPSRFRPIP